jgi:hypothetical protein
MSRSAREITILQGGVLKRSRRLEVKKDNEQSSWGPEHHIGEILGDVMLRFQGSILLNYKVPKSICHERVRPTENEDVRDGVRHFA